MPTVRGASRHVPSGPIIALVACVLAGGALAGCGGKEIAVPKAGDIPIPTFQTLPDDPSRATQLDALVERDTAGLDPTTTAADPSLLAEALAALKASDDHPTKLSELHIFDDDVSFAYEQNGIAGRTVSGSYRRGQGLNVSDPAYDDDPTYLISSIQADVIPKVVAAIQARVPHAVVSDLDLSAGRSNGFGLAWNVDVQDARGYLATVWVDLDGAIVAVDESL